MPDPPFLQSEIEHMRRQVGRQRRQIRDLQRAGIPAKPAEELLERMLAKVGDLCAERDRQIRERRVKYPGIVQCMRSFAVSGGRALEKRYEAADVVD